MSDWYIVYLYMRQTLDEEYEFTPAWRLYCHSFLSTYIDINVPLKKFWHADTVDSQSYNFEDRIN